eukprot:scaffold111911_cov60-Phaeocystis_antarctica.AAC.2
MAYRTAGEKRLIERCRPRQVLSTSRHASDTQTSAATCASLSSSWDNQRESYFMAGVLRTSALVAAFCTLYVAQPSPAHASTMLWLPVLLGSHSSLAAGDSVAKATALSAPQRQLPADTTARDAATKPPRDSASPDATMKRRPEYLESEALVSEAAPAGRALSEVCGACAFDYTANGSPSCCDALWTSNGLDCATLFSSYKMDCAGCNCPGDPSPPPSPPSLPSSLSPPVQPPPLPPSSYSATVVVGITITPPAFLALLTEEASITLADR